MVNIGSITDIVFQAILSSVNGQKSNVPYVVKESMIPWVAYPNNEKKYVCLKLKLFLLLNK